MQILNHNVLSVHLRCNDTIIWLLLCLESPRRITIYTLNYYSELQKLCLNYIHY